LHDAGKHCTELIADALGAIGSAASLSGSSAGDAAGSRSGPMLRSANTSFVTTTAAIAFAQPE
jgi:hypothetical protein